MIENVGYEEMAISIYLGIMLFLLLSYPLLLVVIQLTIYEVNQRERLTKRFNLIFLVVVAILLIMHMQTEVIFGKALLDAWENS